MAKYDFLFLSVEHAGNIVPPEYNWLFENNLPLLETHRGYDPGALEEARTIVQQLQIPYAYQMVTRLLVECNRSPDSTELFSPFSKTLTPEEKEDVLQKYYYPYRNEIENLVNVHQKTLHFSIHTCTDELNGEKRTMDFGILFDPTQKYEVAIAHLLRDKLLDIDPLLEVAFNAPYSGTSDGMTEWLRRHYDQRRYTGIEIETNQKYFIGKDQDTKQWHHLEYTLTKALADIKLEVGGELYSPKN